MPVIKELEPGRWYNEDGLEIKINRAWVTGDIVADITVSMYVPDSLVWVEEENAYRDEAYYVKGANARDIDSIFVSRPPSPGVEAFEGNATEVTLYPDMYSFFIYLVPGDDGEFVETVLVHYYAEE